MILNYFGEMGIGLCCFFFTSFLVFLLGMYGICVCSLKSSGCLEFLESFRANFGDERILKGKEEFEYYCIVLFINLSISH